MQGDKWELVFIPVSGWQSGVMGPGQTGEPMPYRAAWAQAVTYTGNCIVRFHHDAHYYSLQIDAVGWNVSVGMFIPCSLFSSFEISRKGLLILIITLSIENQVSW